MTIGDNRLLLHPVAKWNVIMSWRILIVLRYSKLGEIDFIYYSCHCRWESMQNLKTLFESLLNSGKNDLVANEIYLALPTATLDDLKIVLKVRRLIIFILIF